MASVNPTVLDLYIYPVKSCAGFKVDVMPIGEFGPLWDRQWILVNEKGDKITQRDFPLLSQVRVLPLNYLKGEFKLSYPGMEDIELNVSKIQQTNKVLNIWGESYSGQMVTEDLSVWFTQVIGKKTFLLKNDPVQTNRTTKEKYGAKAKYAFADGFPLLLLTTASMQFLNCKLNKKVSAVNFRPNIVVKTKEAHIEDTWKSFSIENVNFNSVKHCSRCQVVNVNPESGELDSSVLRTLMKYRKTEKGIIFGENLNYLNQGKIKIGSELRHH